jgi:hypothetical protein
MFRTKEVIRNFAKLLIAGLLSVEAICRPLHKGIKVSLLLRLEKAALVTDLGRLLVN